MKRILSIALLVFLALNGCKKIEQDSGSDVGKEFIISEIFKAGMYWQSQINSMRTSQPVNIRVDTTFMDNEGGVIRVLGTINGSISIDETTGNATGGQLSLDLKEIINDYAFNHNGKSCRIDGAPNIFISGNLVLPADKGEKGNFSTIEINGNIHLSGANADDVIGVDLSILMNADATGGHVTGTYGSEVVDYNF